MINVAITFSLSEKQMNEISKFYNQQDYPLFISRLNELVVFLSGFQANTINLYRMIKKIDLIGNVFFLLDKKTYNFFYKSGAFFNGNFIFNKMNIICYPFSEYFFKKNNISLLIECDRIDQKRLSLLTLKERIKNLKIVSYKMINEYSIQNINFNFLQNYSQNIGNNNFGEAFFYFNHYDHIFMIENHKNDCEIILKSLFPNTNYSFVDFIYEPILLDKNLIKKTHSNKKIKIGILDTNNTYNKTFFHPFLFAELLNQSDSNLIESVYLFNISDSIYGNHQFFNIFENTTLYNQDKVKAVFGGYKSFKNIISQYDLDAVISFNQNNSLNYLYYDCYTYNIPLIHNSIDLYNKSEKSDFLYCSNISNIEGIMNFYNNIDKYNYSLLCKKHLDSVSIYNKNNRLEFEKVFKRIFEIE